MSIDAPPVAEALLEKPIAVCGRCGARLPSRWDVCLSPRHTATDGSGAGRAVLSHVPPRRQGEVA